MLASLVGALGFEKKEVPVGGCNFCFSKHTEKHQSKIA